MPIYGTGDYERISIHALLAESDGPVTKGDKDQVVISIHALLAESDQGCGYYYLWALAFLSTLSLRRATIFPCLSSEP